MHKRILKTRLDPSDYTMSNYDDIKAECYEANLLLPEYKLIDLTFGNVSIAAPERRVFAIKPSGVDYGSMKVDDMVVLDFDGKLVEGSLRPSSDTPTHQLLLKAFAGIRSVVHTHSRNAVAFAQAGRAIPCLGTTHADYFYGEVPVTRPMNSEEIRSAYEWETGNIIVERFEHINPMEVCAVLVNGHGPFVWGPTGKKAVENALALEIVAEMALKEIQLNPQVKPVSNHLLDKHFLRKHGATAYYGPRLEIPSRCFSSNIHISPGGRRPVRAGDAGRLTFSCVRLSPIGKRRMPQFDPDIRLVS